ncbi:hypothetical protein QH494_18930 [Sphingomonas sp. AR_OL41]|uniref:hypothetical protein n=1 Tax=Sphingomonas sp. AR_OL41 TaxID=3042729 RepID=UPI0024803D70|nr:hypothetical protein [Sphingomonas sp. AR_OL41]MDH7974267.1 hypothetical protein [Sphingomonas sp. AR_OL41]
MSGNPLYPERLRSERFSQCAKRSIDYSPGFIDRGQRIAPGSQAESDLKEVIRLLGGGSLLPEKFYRNGVGRDYDQLLGDYGIKHLHLGGSTEDIILFLVEYEDSVLLLEVNGHEAFATKPVGSALRALHRSALQNFDSASTQNRAARLAVKVGQVAKGLLPRRPR